MKHVAMGRIVAFCSYAHEDAAHLADLEAALAELRQEAIIDQWSDERIETGSDWDSEIKTSLDRAHLVLFIVTPHLLTSDYINRVEIPRALERQKAKRCEIVPILTVKPDDEAAWHASDLAKIQPAPRPGHWISDYSDRKSAYNLVCLRVREACARIGGGDNPYRRADVGDWRHMLRRAEFPNGQFAEWEYTEAVVEKTEEQAIVAIQTTMHGHVEDKRVTYDLERPLQQQARDVADQVGADFSQAESMTTTMAAGGPDVSEQVVQIGFDAYETRVLSMEADSEHNGLRMHTQGRVWHSIDVPIDGLVQARNEFEWENGLRGAQIVKLLACGHGDADAKRPVPKVRQPLTPEAAVALGLPLPEAAAVAQAGTGVGQQAGGADPFAKIKGAFKDFMSGFREGMQQQQPPPPMQPQILPGRWSLQANDQAGNLTYDVMLFPNGQLQGMAWNNGLQSNVQGVWGFDPASATLRIDVTAMAMGYPPNPFWATFTITGSDPTAYHAHDMAGRAFRIWRTQ